MQSSEKDRQVSVYVVCGEIFTQKAAGEPAAFHPDNPVLLM